MHKTNQKEFRIEKVKREKAINTIVHGKDTITHLMAILVKKTYYKWVNIFSKLKSLGANLKVELELTNYAAKEDLKNVASVDVSSFSKKTDLANLKSDVDKIDIDKLKNVPSGLSSLNSKIDN